jgi:hypothetical protein
MTSVFLSWRWWVIAALLLAGCRPVAPPPPAVATPDATVTIDVIAFGSCARQTKPQPIWDAVLATAPDLFVFLGDNVYGDTTDMAELRRAYALLAAQPGFQRLRATTPVVATWDDHDYGLNDVGGDYPAKYGSREVFLDFWGEPPDSERRLRNGGIYAAYAVGTEGRRVRVILLDTRNRALAIETVYKGSLNMAVVRVGELFRAALKANAAAIILVHNHPSGDPAPSPEDIRLTRDAVQAGKLMSVEVLDHLVIGQGRYISLKERGLGF